MRLDKDLCEHKQPLGYVSHVLEQHSILCNVRFELLLGSDCWLVSGLGSCLDHSSLSRILKDATSIHNRTSL